ncbi:anthranilate synthase component I family protein [Psychrobacter sp. B38]|uniref:anthranilate synthase component I family protein n=1 Tax=Psychrobacter sp. B38 TaxID=3143538 RepID=UPI00320FA7A0
MSVENHTTAEQTASAPSPATNPSWRFGDLSAVALMPHLQRHLLAQNCAANWQLVWLNNDGHPVIGLLPKISWSVYPAADQLSDAHSKPVALYQVTKHCRDACVIDSNAESQSVTTTYISYAAWQDELITYSQGYEHNDCGSKLVDRKQSKPSYHHGLIGFIGYDIAAHELSPTANIERATQPCAVLGHYDIYLAPARQGEVSVWTLTVHQPSDDYEISNDDKENKALITTLICYLNALDKKLSDKALNQAQFKALPNPAPLTLTARWHQHDYQKAFNQTQDYLQQGDCYQINLTQVWQTRLLYKSVSDQPTSTLIDYLPSLHRNTQAPFAGYLSTQYCHETYINKNHAGQSANAMEQKNTFELLSCSPELFFTFIKDNKTGKHHIRTKPIKGTMPRGVTLEQDNHYKQQLSESEKDRAENVMIVDLLRNDLGKYAKIGSVKVPQLFAIESFSNVHHMVSTISAELKTDTHPLTVLFGSLPAGSITGTPKKRSVEIISELEVAARGAYCGTMGYMNFDGSGQWNVLIRTLQANLSSGLSSNNGIQQEGHVSLWAGGGITVASDCSAEYQECLDKVGNLLSVLAQKP